MITLYDSPFSPFARKVRIALEHKGLAHEVIDGLAKHNHDALRAVNGRIEVPVLVHDAVTVVNSADIIAYLERVFPETPVYPTEPSEYVRARAWERCSDSLVDAILTDIGYWMWAERPDTIPDGLLDKAKADLDQVYTALERDLEAGPFLCGAAVSIAEIALFPHLAATRASGVPFDAKRFPRLQAWFSNVRKLPVFAADIERIKQFIAAAIAARDYERRKLFWRGDRIEWLLASGYHAWFAGEIAADRVAWPGLSIPEPRAKRS